MGDVVQLRDRCWKQVATVYGVAGSTLHVFSNEMTQEVDVVQVNGEGEAVTTRLSAVDASLVHAALAPRSKVARKR